MRLALPVWNGSVSPVFDSAEMLLIVGIDDREATTRRELSMAGMDGRRRVELVAESADVVVCGAISRDMLACLVSRGITVHPWIMGTVETIIAQFIDGGSPGTDFLMPGCRRNRYGQCGQGRRCGGRGRRGSR